MAFRFWKSGQKKMSPTEKLGGKSLMRWAICRRSPPARCAAQEDLKYQDQIHAFMKHGILYRHYEKRWAFKDEASPDLCPPPPVPQNLELNVNKERCNLINWVNLCLKLWCDNKSMWPAWCPRKEAFRPTTLVFIQPPGGPRFLSGELWDTWARESFLGLSIPG